MVSGFHLAFPFGIFRGLTGANSLCADKQHEPSRYADKQNEPSRRADKQNKQSPCADKPTNKINSVDLILATKTYSDVEMTDNFKSTKVRMTNEWQVRTFIRPLKKISRFIISARTDFSQRIDFFSNFWMKENDTQNLEVDHCEKGNIEKLFQ